MNCPCGAPLTDKQEAAIKLLHKCGTLAAKGLCDKCWMVSKQFVGKKPKGKNKSNRGEK